MTRTVVRNLVTNAIKFTEKGGAVAVECVDMGNHVDISVIDSGVGVSPENQEKLFKVGENCTTSGTAREKGTGLGLILTAEFVEKNNGRIEYKSAGTKDDGSQKGSIFTFSLPKKNA
ncbi:MAG: ATP-binding protein [bacterium]|nr:ATP-binding protein [bacterium]